MLAILAMFMLPDLMPAVHASEATATESSVAAAPASAAAAAPASAAAAEPVANAITYPPAPKLTEADYPQIKGVNSRVAVWLVAQLHLWFGAHVRVYHRGDRHGDPG